MAAACIRGLISLYYLLTMKEIYLDYAAATPVDPAVLKAMRPFFDDRFYNPSALYRPAVQAARALQDARERVARCLGCRPAEVVFTAGGTEANNLAIRGLLEQFPDSHAVATVIEHDAVLAPLERFDHTLAPVNDQGLVEPAAIAAAITDRTVLISVMQANNEVGTVQPLRDIAALIEQVRTERRASGNDRPLYLHTDACQAAAYLDINVSRLGVDLMTLNAGKIYGPKQSGVLFVKGGIRLTPQILGGGQERGLRSGTENLAGSVGFATALELVQARRKEESRRLLELRNLFTELIKREVPDAVINGSLKHRLPNNVHLTLPGHDNERLMFALDEQGIRCGLGSACSAANQKASHVLAALGLSEETARSSLRFSLGRDTTEADIRTTVAALKQLI